MDPQPGATKLTTSPQVYGWLSPESLWQRDASTHGNRAGEIHRRDKLTGPCPKTLLLQSLSPRSDSTVHKEEVKVLVPSETFPAGAEGRNIRVTARSESSWFFL